MSIRDRELVAALTGKKKSSMLLPNPFLKCLTAVSATGLLPTTSRSSFAVPAVVPFSVAMATVAAPLAKVWVEAAARHAIKVML
jgi:hypothetical protein